MHKQIFVNLAVKDLPRSVDFFKALGYVFDLRFTNESGACLVLGDNLYAMLLARPFFQTFTHKALSDPTQTTEVAGGHDGAGADWSGWLLPRAASWTR